MSFEVPFDQISVKVAIISNELRRLATLSFEDWCGEGFLVNGNHTRVSRS